MGGSVFVCFMLVAMLAMTLLGYVTGYMDGQDRKDRNEKKSTNNRDDRRSKRIDFDLRGRR